MSNKVNKYILQLINNGIMETDDEFELFEDAIANLADLVTIDDIPMLCKCLNDSTNEDEVMFGLIHLIEKFEDDRSIELIVQGVLEIIENTRGWSKILIKRILNNDSARNVCGFVFEQLDTSSREIMIGVLEEIKCDNPKKFEEKVNFVLKRLKDVTTHYRDFSRE